MAEFKNTDIDDVKYRAEQETFQDADYLYIDGDGIWARGSSVVPPPEYVKNGRVYETSVAVDYSMYISKPGVYQITAYAAGGGAAMAAWSNKDGTLGGVAVAPGGSGATATVKGNFSGLTLNFHCGQSGISKMHTVRGTNEAVNITGGTGGSTYVTTHIHIDEHIAYDHGMPRRIPARDEDVTLVSVTGGKGGHIEFTTASGADSVINRVVKGGAGGIVKVASSTNSNSVSSANGMDGVPAVLVDAESTGKPNLSVLGNTTGSFRGIGAGGIAKKTATKTSVNLECQETVATEYGYTLIQTAASTPDNPDFVLVGGDGYIRVTYISSPSYRLFLP